jgi:hypothetical protein
VTTGICICQMIPDIYWAYKNPKHLKPQSAVVFCSDEWRFLHQTISELMWSAAPIRRLNRHQHNIKYYGVHCEGYCSTGRTVTFTVHTARVPAPHNHSQHYQCRTPYATVHTIVLLMMGIVMPETC